MRSFSFNFQTEMKELISRCDSLKSTKIIEVGDGDGDSKNGDQKEHVFLI